MATATEKMLGDKPLSLGDRLRFEFGVDPLDDKRSGEQLLIVYISFIIIIVVIIHRHHYCHHCHSFAWVKQCINNSNTDMCAGRLSKENLLQ